MTFPVFQDSELDGEEWGGFVVVNVDAALANPYQILEDDDGETYFSTLEQARRVCAQLREENNNRMIFVYALAGVRDAIAAKPDIFGHSA